MKTIYIAILAGLLAGCSSAPRKILMKNCTAAGSSLYYCEEIPKKEINK